MNAKHRGVSTDTRAALDAEGPLRRWSRRRHEVAREDRALAEARRSDVADDGAVVPEPDDGAREPAVVEERVLTDEDMPSLDGLDENSDYSGFLSTGVSEGLRRRALRKLFASAVFNVPDGLDDYDDDFTSFAALGDIVTSDMRHQAEVEAERARQARSEPEPASGLQEETGPLEGEPLAGADDEGAGGEEPVSAEEEAPGEPETLAGAQHPGERSGKHLPESADHADRLRSGTGPEVGAGACARTGRTVHG